MTGLIIDHHVYFLIVALLVIGIYGMLGKTNLIKKIIGMNIFQTAIFLFYIAGAAKDGASVPVIEPTLGVDPVMYINPLPHLLILTAIVVGISITGVALAMLINIRRHYPSLDEKSLLEEMSK